jgi:hypothetical protein
MNVAVCAIGRGYIRKADFLESPILIKPRRRE